MQITTQTVILFSFCGKAVDGCYFLPNDGDNNYISRMRNGSVAVTNFNLQKVSPSDNGKVINAELDGITSDGKYFSKRRPLAMQTQAKCSVT